MQSIPRSRTQAHFPVGVGRKRVNHGSLFQGVAVLFLNMRSVPASFPDEDAQSQ